MTSASAEHRPPRIVHLVAFLWGVQSAFLNPALALLLVSTFGASTTQVAVVLTIYNGACLVPALLIPRWADRRGSYVAAMTACAALTVALAVALSLAHSLWIAVVGLVLLGAPAAVGAPLLFGHIRHLGAGPAQVVRSRAMFSTAWVAGPPAASVIVSVAGGRALVLCVGVVGGLNLVALSGLRAGRSVARVGATVRAASQHSLARRSTIALVVVTFACLQASNSTSTSITTLFATRTLHLSPIWGGSALGVAAALEVPTLLLLGRRSRRVSDTTALTAACGVGVAYFAVVSIAPNGPALIAAQVLNACFYGVVAGVGLTLFQSIIEGPGAAAGLLANAQRVGGLLTGPLVGIASIAPGGLRAVFAACAGIAAVSLILTRFVHRQLAPASPRPAAAANRGT